MQEESIFNELNEEPAFEDDKSFSRTKDYTSRVQLLRLLYNALVKTVESWESFEAGEIRFFDLPNDGILQALWNSYLADMEKDMTELRFLCRSVQQRIEMFDNMRNGVRAVYARALSFAKFNSLSTPLPWLRAAWRRIKIKTLASSRR